MNRNDRSAGARTDRLTGTQNFGRYNIIPSPLFVAGHKKNPQNMLITSFGTISEVNDYCESQDFNCLWKGN